jgi:hypothetical protein
LGVAVLGLGAGVWFLFRRKKTADATKEMDALPSAVVVGATAQRQALLDGATQAQAAQANRVARAQVMRLAAEASAKAAPPADGTPIQLANWTQAITTRAGDVGRAVGCPPGLRPGGRFKNRSLATSMGALRSWSWQSRKGTQAARKPPPPGAWAVIRSADISLKRGGVAPDCRVAD